MVKMVLEFLRASRDLVKPAKSFYWFYIKAGFTMSVYINSLIRLFKFKADFSPGQNRVVFPHISVTVKTMVIVIQ